MKIVIDIPEEFEEHFKRDHFEDSLARIETDIHTLRCKRMSGIYEQETISMIHKAFVDAVPYKEVVEK